ncbi:uncharacterized protein LOC133778448 [Humulus lupulus]|uniref:uncharacterized protein LOC133778448 n=1 Tax=Humulus lupulus TaxID=3486 RepID=UPI002B40FE14|nr:uncharacterized protein LOC133778448 [Humulus lupulus]
MLYEPQIFNACKDIEEADNITGVSFSICAINRNDRTPIHSCRVKTCGFHLLYLEEALEFGLLINDGDDNDLSDFPEEEEEDHVEYKLSLLMQTKTTKNQLEVKYNPTLLQKILKKMSNQAKVRLWTILKLTMRDLGLHLIASLLCIYILFKNNHWNIGFCRIGNPKKIKSVIIT